MSMGLGFVCSELIYDDYPPTNEIRTARVYRESLKDFKAILVLCPGDNGDGSEWMKEKGWFDFAREQGWLLMGIHFTSDHELLQKDSGYYEAEGVSGRYLQESIRRAKAEGVPLFLYGLSGGAHYVSRFVNAFPKQVTGFCVYSAGWWVEPRSGLPPGIVACGEHDGFRYGASLHYFTQGRKQNNRWSWVSLPKTKHERNLGLESLVRQFFKDLLEKSKWTPQWHDILTKKNQTLPDLSSSWSPSLDYSRQWLLLQEKLESKN
jgi:hypothetical protein